MEKRRTTQQQKFWATMSFPAKNSPEKMTGAAEVRRRRPKGTVNCSSFHEGHKGGYLVRNGSIYREKNTFEVEESCRNLAGKLKR
ncbi:hypothetical protein P8452_77101 [Trifolium repens]|nr:hypothetical protein P8452_77101 [Trifolium repens]